MQKSFDGKFSFADLQNTLATEEQLGFVLLTNLKKRLEPPPANIGTFADDPNPGSPKPLLLVEIKATDNVATVTADQLHAGRTLVSCEQVFVSSQEVKVAVFR